MLAPRPIAFLLVLSICFSLAPRLRAAENDDNVEWNGVFSDSSYRSPRYPARDEAFRVELRVFRGDISGARVRTWTGTERFHDMSWSRNTGPAGEYDVWTAMLPGSGTDYLYYRFEIRDGSDVDHYNGLGMWGDAPPRGDFLVDLTAYGGYPLGTTLTEAGVVFRLWAPNAASAAVAGEFNGWSTIAHPMTRNQGFWQTLVPAAGAGDEYKLVLDGDLWRTDPRARDQVTSAGNSVLVDPAAYAWGDDGWVTPYFEDMIVYELHVGTFSGEGDGVAHYPGRYRDVVDRHLDHLADLGINVIELMPLGEFAGDVSWGYNPTFQYAPESAYGSPENLKHLVDRCHQRGIAVILDVVYNHMGPGDLAGNLLEFDGEEIYFYPPGSDYRETPWGPRPDYGRLEVRDYLCDNIRYWLEEYHLDGFRLDGTDFVKVNGEGWQLLREIAETVDTVSPKAIVIAEQLPNDPAVTRPLAEGGAGADYQWNDALHDGLRAAIRESRFGDPSMAAIARGLDHEGYPSTTMVNYIESHDEAAVHGRIAVEADDADPDGPFARGRAQVAMALVVLSAGTPMLLQGQEWLEARPFGDLREHRIQWRLREENAGFLRFTKDLIALRRTVPSLRSSAPQNVFHVNDGANVLAFQRWTTSGDDLVVAVSLSNDDFPRYALGFPQAGRWYEVINGDAAAYGGGNLGNGGQVDASGGALHGLPASAEIVLPARGVLVFAREPAATARPFLRGDCNGDGDIDIGDGLAVLWTVFVPDDALSECAAACDVTGDDALDVLDAIVLLQFLFGRGAAPAAPFPECVPAGALSCREGCA